MKTLRKSKHIVTFRAIRVVLALLATGSFAGLASCEWPGGGGSSIPSTDLGDRYGCTCSCEVKTGDSLQSHQEVVGPGRANTCAASSYNASLQCPLACSDYLKAEYKRTGAVFTGSQVLSCRTTGTPQFESNSCNAKKTSALMSSKPRDATLEGPIDFGLSYMNVRLPQVGDHARVNLQGQVAIIGGNCPGYTCPIQVSFARLTPKYGDFVTRQGRSFAGLVALNQGTWSGTTYPDGTFRLAPESELAVSARVDGRHTAHVVKPSQFIQGRVQYNRMRTKWWSRSRDNAIIIDGTLNNSTLSLDLHLHSWLTNCRPKISAQASCWGGADGTEQYVRLHSSAEILGNLSGADLCEAMKESDSARVCYAGGSVEWPYFFCRESGISWMTPEQRAQRLTFTWRDASGTVLGTRNDLFLRDMPAFPVTLTVENEFGKRASREIRYMPTGVHCPSVEAQLDDGLYGFGGWGW